MENEIIPTPQAPIIPPEIIKPKKKIILPIIISIIFILLIGIIFYQQKQITALKITPIIVIPTATPTTIPETPIPTKTVEQEISSLINPNNNPNFTFEIKKTDGNFALVNYDNAWHILKRETGVWRHLIGANGDWVCGVIFNENIPPVLVDYGCIYSTNGQAPYSDFYKYNKVTNKWEKQ